MPGAPDADRLAERVARVRERIREACRAAGRPADSVRLVAVSKTRPPAEIEAAAAFGVRHFGENRVQEAAAKLPAVSAEILAKITPHLIGRLQRNKARTAVRLFPVVESVDSVPLARRLSRIAGEEGRALTVFAQADLAGEASKTGIPAADLEPALAEIRELPGLRLAGLMVIPPFDPDPEGARPYFARLRELGERFAGAGLLPPEPELSMGMSHDYPAAIAEGATTVRLGTAIFGPRTPPAPGG